MDAPPKIQRLVFLMEVWLGCGLGTRLGQIQPKLQHTLPTTTKHGGGGGGGGGNDETAA